MKRLAKRKPPGKKARGKTLKMKASKEQVKIWKMIYGKDFDISGYHVKDK